MTEEEELKALWEIAHEVATNKYLALNEYDHYECAFCVETGDRLEDFKHDDTCIVTKARALILHSPLVEKKGNN